MNVQIKKGIYRESKAQLRETETGQHFLFSQEVVSDWLFGGNASGFLRSSFEYDELFLQVFVELQDGRHVTTPETEKRTISALIS